MATATKISVDSTKNSLDLSKKRTNVTTLSSKSTSELYNLRNNKRSESTEPKKDDFKDVLDSKTNSKSDEISNVDKYEKDDNAGKLDELKEKLEELEGGTKKLSNDDINELLNSILNLLNKLGVSDDSLNLNNGVNAESVNALLDGMKEVKNVDNDLSTIMNNLLEALKTDSVKESLDNDSLSLIQKLLSQLGENITDDNSEVGNNLKSGIKNLMSEISNILESKNGEKVLTLEDMLKNNLSQDTDGSLNSESGENSSTETSKSNSGISKEDKFLKSLLVDDKDSALNKMNLFASKNQNNVQGQVVNSKVEMVVNKATFANDLIQDVKYMTTNSIKELTVKVNPGNLGEITIKLIQEDGVMKANLKANSKETTALLSQNLVDIKKQLGEQNIKISEVNIELYQDDTTFFRQDGFDRQLSQEQGRNQSNNNNKVTGIGAISDDDFIEESEIIDNSNVNFLA